MSTKLWLYYRLAIVWGIFTPLVWLAAALSLVLTFGQIKINANVCTNPDGIKNEY